MSGDDPRCHCVSIPLSCWFKNLCMKIKTIFVFIFFSKCLYCPLGTLHRDELNYSFLQNTHQNVVHLVTLTQILSYLIDLDHLTNHLHLTFLYSRWTCSGWCHDIHSRLRGTIRPAPRSGECAKPIASCFEKFGCEHHLLTCLLLWPTWPANFE